MASAAVEFPSLAVVGSTVGLREQLSWFETKPLFGWTVLVPRTKDQAGSMTARLSAYGATSDVVPTISVEPPRTPQQMERAIKGLVTGRYEWIGFTSVNAVRAVREKFVEYGLDARAFAGLKIAAVGGVTAQALREWGLEPDLVPSGEHSAQGLLEAWPPFDEVLDPINRVFLPRADIATDTLVAGLQDMGWEVDDVTAYRTVRAAPPAASVREAIKTGRYDAVVFTSQLDGAQPGRHRRQAAHLDRRRLHRPGHGQDRRGARPAGRRPGDRGLGRLAGGLAGRLRHGPRARGRRGRRDRRAPERRARRGPTQGASDGVPRPSGPGGCGRARRSGGWWPRPGCTRATWCCRCSSARAPPSRCRSARCPASSSTRWSRWCEVAKEAVAAGLGGLMVFGVPLTRDAAGSGADDPDGILNVALRAVRDAVGDDLVLMADLCLDEFTDHGHCGVLDDRGGVDNDATLERYGAMAPRAGRRRRPRGRPVRDDGRPGRPHPARCWTTPATRTS